MFSLNRLHVHNDLIIIQEPIIMHTHIHTHTHTHTLIEQLLLQSHRHWAWRYCCTAIDNFVGCPARIALLYVMGYIAAAAVHRTAKCCLQNQQQQADGRRSAVVDDYSCSQPQLWLNFFLQLQ